MAFQIIDGASKKNTVTWVRVASIEKEQIKYFPIKSIPLFRKLSNLFHIEMRPQTIEVVLLQLRV